MAQLKKQTVLVALDIAKRKHNATILYPSGKKLNMIVTNSLEGYHLLLKRCQSEHFTVHVTEGGTNSRLSS